MIWHAALKSKKFAAALILAGGLQLAGTSQAAAHDVFVHRQVIARNGDRIVYRYPVRHDHGSWRDRRPYYYRNDRGHYWGPPPWAASWYRSNRWKYDRHDHQYHWKDRWRGHGWRYDD